VAHSAIDHPPLGHLLLLRHRHHRHRSEVISRRRGVIKPAYDDIITGAEARTYWRR
jgi:hypothetical protein